MISPAQWFFLTLADCTLEPPGNLKIPWGPDSTPRPINFWKWGPGINPNVQSGWRTTHTGEKNPNLHLCFRFILSFNSLQPSSLVMRKILQLHSVYIYWVNLCNWPFLIRGFPCQLAYTWTFSISDWNILKSKLLALETLSLTCLHHLVSAGTNNNALYVLVRTVVYGWQCTSTSIISSEPHYNSGKQAGLLCAF